MKKARLLLKRYLAVNKGNPQLKQRLANLLQNCTHSFLKKELAKKLLSFPQLESTILYVIIRSVPAYRLAAWEQLKLLPETGGKIAAICDIIREIAQLRQQASDYLVTLQLCTNEVLIGIMSIDTPSADWSWQEFQKRAFSREELISVIEESGRLAVSRSAWKMYVEIHPTLPELESIIEASGLMTAEAAALALSQIKPGRKQLINFYDLLQGDSGESLVPIVTTIREMLATYEGDNEIYRLLCDEEKYPQKQEELLDKILENSPSRDDLAYVIDTTEKRKKRRAAANLLLAKRPTEKEILSIFDHNDLQSLIWKHLTTKKKISSDILDRIGRFPRWMKASHSLRINTSRDRDFLWKALSSFS